MDLYIVRHAIAFDADPTRWPDDSQRPLTSNGKKRFAKAARGLREIVPSVDVVLSSPYTRAWQTAEILQKTARYPEPTRCDELASHRATSDVVPFLQQSYVAAQRAVLVGHEPNLHELISYLLSGDSAHVQLEMKKGAVACLTFEDHVEPGSALLRWLLPPRALRLIG